MAAFFNAEQALLDLVGGELHRGAGQAFGLVHGGVGGLQQLLGPLL
jgi:hypothetical protein